MIERRFLEEWPLAAFTLAIQVACGLAIATTLATLTQSTAQSSAVRTLGIAVFPIVAAGILLSLVHLGRPASAWRALGNCLHSRLSLEVLLTAAFGVSSFAYSLIWWNGTASFLLYVGATASMLGLAAVMASAAIYQIPTKRIWNSAWVIASFIGSTVVVAGFALSICCSPSRLGTSAVIVGSALLLLSGAWMWVRVSHPLEHPTWFRIWLTAYLLLVLATPLVLISTRSSTLQNGVALASCSLVLGLITGRMLMLALGELEARF